MLKTHFAPDKKIANNKGFTLVELLVVISIIGGLAALLLANFVGVRGRATDARTKSDLKNLQTALRLYYNDYQKYPDASNGSMLGCGSAGTTACSDGGEFGGGTTVYMKILPESYDYYSDGADEFLLVSTLENASDADIQSSQDRCNVAGRAYVPGGAVDSATDFVICES